MQSLYGAIANYKSYYMENKNKSKGLGDSVAKFTKATGIQKVVDTVAKTVKKDCGCNKRQNTLNRLFPYNN